MHLQNYTIYFFPRLTFCAKTGAIGGLPLIIPAFCCKKRNPAVLHRSYIGAISAYWGILLMLNCRQNKSTRENNRYGKTAPSCQTKRLKTKPLIKTRKAFFWILHNAIFEQLLAEPEPRRPEFFNIKTAWIL